jgi:hypothetical protein
LGRKKYFWHYIEYHMLSTFTIQVNSNKALQLIKDLEALELIKILPQEGSGPVKPSDLLQGCISHEQAEKWRNELKQMRNEWERDI